MEKRQVYGALYVVLGFLLAGIQIQHAIAGMTVPIAIVFDAAPFALLGLALAYTGWWLARNEAFEPDLERITAWVIGGTVTFASVAALLLFSQRVSQGTLARASYLAIDNVTVGLITGMLVGLYDAQSTQRFRALQNERDRVEEFANKATDLNNYGRALTQCRELEAVSAYAIEAVSTLLGYDESVFLTVAPDGSQVLGNTAPHLDERVIERLATRACDQEDGTVTVSDGIDVGSDDAQLSDAVISMHVTSVAEDCVVMLTLKDPAEPIGTEDRQLLELLVKQTSMVVNRIYRQRAADDETPVVDAAARDDPPEE